MPRSCTVCTHPEGFAINEAVIVEGKSNRAIASQYGVGRDSIQRHKAHIPELLLKAQENKEAYDAASILAKIRSLEEETLEQLQGAKGENDRKHVLAAIREQRANLELVSRISKLISDATTVNIVQDPTFVQFNTLVVDALEPYPEARRAVLGALRGVQDA
jgi:hypothetical protein